MSYKKSLPCSNKSFITGLFIFCFSKAVLSGQGLEPVLKGKDPLPESTLDPRIDAVDAVGNKPDGGNIESGKELQGMLLQAIGTDDISQAQYLVSRGAEVNLPFSDEGDTPLMLAQSLEMARTLVQEGAEVNARDSKKGTTLHYAVTRPSAKKLIPFLVEAGADINARGWQKKTPLNLAVTYLNENRAADIGIIEVLVESGADINAPDQNGYTGLMQAAAIGNSLLVDLLLSLGADKTLTDPCGKTAREIAYESGSRYIYQRLR